MVPAKDFRGQRFGRWTVLNVPHRPGHNVEWYCRCMCGAEKWVRGSHLSSGMSRSCGCLNAGLRFTLGHDLTGQVFHRLTVVRISPVRGGVRKWECLCQCGNECVAKQQALLTGKQKSCGCYQREMRGKTQRKHGATGTSLYKRWNHIKSRCLRPQDPAFKCYGGRGITICEEWARSYEAFAAHIGEPPSENHSIDRIDNNRGYEPGNVRWALPVDQCNNTRRNRVVEVDGQAMTVAQWSRVTGVSQCLIIYRLNAGWDARDAVWLSPNPKRTRKRT